MWARPGGLWTTQELRVPGLTRWQGRKSPPEREKVRAGPASPEALQGSDSRRQPRARATSRSLTFGTNRPQAPSSSAPLEYSRPVGIPYPSLAAVLTLGYRGFPVGSAQGVFRTRGLWRDMGSALPIYAGALSWYLRCDAPVPSALRGKPRCLISRLGLLVKGS